MLLPPAVAFVAFFYGLRVMRRRQRAEAVIAALAPEPDDTQRNTGRAYPAT